MKNNTLYDPDIGIRFNMLYYQEDIPPAIARALGPIVWRQYTFWQRLQSMIIFVLNTLQRLQRSRYFRREQRWQLQLARSVAALTNPALQAGEMIVALQQANDVIEAACQIGGTRRAIAIKVQEKLLLSSEQEQQYRATRHRYEAHNLRLNQLEEQVTALQIEHTGFRRRTQPQTSSPAMLFTPAIPQSFPHPLFGYAREKEALRVIEDSLDGYMRTDQNARTLHRTLAKKLIYDKPAREQLTEDQQAAQSFLQHKSQLILSHTTRVCGHVTQHLREAITHRRQTIIAHTQKKERLLTGLNHIIQLLQPLLSVYGLPGQPLLMVLQQRQAKQSFSQPVNLPRQWPEQGRLLAHIVWTACAAQSALSAPKKLAPAQAINVQKNIEAMDGLRRQFAAAMTSSWSTFFSSARRARREQELSLNAQLQAETAQLAHAVYGLKDVNTVMTSKQVRQEQRRAEQLKTLAVPVMEEQARIAHLFPVFGR